MCRMATRWGKALRTLCLERGVRRAMYVAIGLQVCQQLSGVNAFVYYTPTVLKEAGVDGAAFGIEDANAAAMVSTLVAYLPKLPFVLVASSLMDYTGAAALRAHGCTRVQRASERDRDRDRDKRGGVSGGG